MNFLSHFYNEQPCSEPYIIAGVILPDILSNYSYRSGEVIKLHAGKLVETQDSNFAELSAGVQKHYAADDAFHESDFFHSNVDMIRDIVHRHGLKHVEKRLYALAHVMLEIMLDRKLLVENSHTCDELYRLINEVDLARLEGFMALNHHAAHAAGVARHFGGFREVKFIYDYTDDGRLMELLGRINQRLGNNLFTPEDKTSFKAVIHDIEKALLSQKFPKFRTDL